MTCGCELQLFIDSSVCVFPFFLLCLWGVEWRLCFYGYTYHSCAENFLLVLPIGWISWYILCKSVLILEYLVLSIDVYERFARLISMVSCNVWSTYIQNLLDLIISIEKTGVILIGLPFYVTWHFSFATLNILFFPVCFEFCLWYSKGIFCLSPNIFFFYIFLILTIMCSVSNTHIRANEK